MRIHTIDGETFEGASPQEIVRQMRNTEWGAPERKRDYMVEVIDRVEQQTGVFADPDGVYEDPENPISAMQFLEYLHHAGVLTTIDRQGLPADG
jgi:hypothetical protein